VNVLHPGAIATGIWREVPEPLKWLIGVILSSPARGAAPVVRLATDPALDGVTGRYFSRFREAEPARRARLDADAVKLWEIAQAATGLVPAP
jgi:dehydrogenase/reductase SDR family protein 13